MFSHRSMRRNALAAFVAMGVFGATAGAGAQAAPRVITLEEAIQIAREQNPTILQAQNSARLNALTVQQSRNIVIPTVRIGTSTNAPYLTSIGQSDPSLSGNVSANVQVSNIYSTLASLEQARLNEQGGQQNLERSLQTVAYNVISSYISVIEAQEQVTVQRENLVTVEAQERQIEAMVEQGRRPISDLYQQQASTAGAMFSLVQAERGLVVSRMNLIRTLQIDPFGEFEFVAPDPTPTMTFASLNYEDLAARASQDRPDLIAAQLSLGSARQGARIASANRWPALSLSLGYSSNFNSLSNGGFVDQLDQRRNGALQLGVSVPLFDPNARITRERAAIQVENARISLENTSQNVQTEVRTAYLDLALAEQQLEVAELQLRAAELALETAQARYEVQAATLVELEQARLTHLRAATTLVSTRYSLLLQTRLLEYYIGNLDV